MYAPEGYKAVCFRCSYESLDGREQRCPVCQFAFILEPEQTPAGGRKLETILKRSSVADDAPPLPGVHVGKRKAQLLAEARKQRLTERRARASTRPVTVEPRTGGGTAVAARRGARAIGKLTFAVLCVSAVAAGALAAVLQHGGL
jgi:hypothetical protein